MSFNLAAFEAKMAALTAALPAIGKLILAAHAVAPGAAGLTKASLVINTAMAAEPALIDTEEMLSAAVSGVVSAYRSAGVLPAPVATAADASVEVVAAQ